MSDKNVVLKVMGSISGKRSLGLYVYQKGGERNWNQRRLARQEGCWFDSSWRQEAQYQSKEKIRRILLEKNNYTCT